MELFTCSYGLNPAGGHNPKLSRIEPAPGGEPGSRLDFGYDASGNQTTATELYDGRGFLRRSRLAATNTRPLQPFGTEMAFTYPAPSGLSGGRIMKRTPIASILLLAIALAMSAGPHPCHAASRPDHATPAVAEHASCHSDRQASKVPSGGHDCCDPEKGGHALCNQACQSAAVLGVAPSLSAVSSFEELTVPVQDRSAPLFVLAIDHIPLT